MLPLKNLIRFALPVAAFAAWTATASASPVPITYTVDYFTVTPAATPAGDFNTQCCYGPVSDVTNTLMNGLRSGTASER